MMQAMMRHVRRVAMVAAVMGCSVPQVRASDCNYQLDFTQRSHLTYDPATMSDATAPLNFDVVTPSSDPQAPKKLVFTADIGTQFKTWLDASVPPHDAGGSARSLAVQITSQLNDNVKDKIVFSPVPRGKAFSPEMTDTKFLAFDFKLDRGYEVPRYWALHLQIIPCCNRPNPPFFIGPVSSGDKDGPVRFSFYVRNDETIAKGSESIEIYRSPPLARDTWYNLALRFEPNFTGKTGGGITIWINGTQVAKYTGRWGFTPAPNLDSRVGFDLGVYRRRQPSTQTIYFENVRLGDSLAYVRGEQPGSSCH